MSLAIAAATENAIHVAVDSFGTHPAGPLSSKLFKLQASQEIWMAVTGGLGHWRDVADRCLPQKSLRDAAANIAELLDACTTRENCAFALVVGFEEKQPVCYKLGREPGSEIGLPIRTLLLTGAMAIGTRDIIPNAAS